MDPNTRYTIYKMQARTFKAIAHPLRVAILEYLKDGERCVCQIAEHIGSERSNVSRHLAVMVAGGVLKSRKQGQMVFYRVKARCVVQILDCIHELLKDQLAEGMQVIRSMSKGAEQ